MDSSRRFGVRFACIALFTITTAGSIAGCTASGRRSVSIQVVNDTGSLTGSAVSDHQAFSNLTVDEVCGLIDTPTANSLMEYSFDEAEWQRDDAGSRCGFDSTSDGYQGDRLSTYWFVGAPGSVKTILLSRSDHAIRTESTIDGSPAVLVVDGESAEVHVSLANRDLSVSTFADRSDRIAKNPERIMAMMSKLIAATNSLKPSEQPADDAKVASSFEMSPAQLCSLLRGGTVDAMRTLAGVEPTGVDDQSSIRTSQAECTKGRGQLSLAISSWATHNETSLRIGGLPAFWSTDGEADSKRTTVTVESVRNIDGGELETVLALSMRGVPDTVEVRELLTSEMEYIIGELGRRLPEPLVWQLLDRVIPDTTMEPLPTGLHPDIGLASSVQQLGTFS